MRRSRHGCIRHSRSARVILSAWRVALPRLIACLRLLLLAVVSLMAIAAAVARPAWGGLLASWTARKLGVVDYAAPAVAAAPAASTTLDPHSTEIADLASALANLGMPKRKSMRLAAQAVESAGQDFDVALKWALANK